MGEVVVSGGGGDVVAGGTEEKRRGTDDKDGSSEVVRWEKFLPRMVLRVLLVEADDSTRHIISALLRKCSYKVDAVPDGLMAWEALKGGPHNIDLILTEVELPSISGYALLTLVMEDDICKKIPVIMMSSQDSISTVLKCMLKGAADFLIKPVRRNELKNLWQHVWRRQPLNVGHIPQDSPNAQYKVEAGSENNSTSDHSSDCAIYSRKRKECSDERSDSQMECRMRSTPSNTEKENKECLILDEKSIIPDTKSRDWSTRLESVGASHNEDHNPTARDLGEEFTHDKIIIQDESVKLESDRENVITSHCPNSEPVESSGVIDLIGTFVDGPECTYGHLNMHDGTNKFEFTPQLELSLTRFSATDSKDQRLEGRPALNHSNGSAFSWYNNKTLQPLFPTATSKCTDTEFKENVNKSPEQSFDAVCQHNNGGSQKTGANLDGNQESATTLVIGQSAEAELAYQNSQKLIPVSGVRLDNTCNGYIHASPPVCHAQTVVPLQEGWSPKHASQREHSPFPIGTSIHSNPETQNHENKVEDKVDETAINSVDQHMQQHNNVEVVEEARPGSPVSGYSRSSSMSNSVADHNNSSAYGSFSNRSDGNASFAVTSEKPTVPESLDDSGRLFVRDGFRGMDAHRSSQREAALTKFRLKRKDRCYEKKVRYQSRKRLAEQRPRVKGQFVRQVQNDASIANANE